MKVYLENLKLGNFLSTWLIVARMLLVHAFFVEHYLGITLRILRFYLVHLKFGIFFDINIGAL